MKTDVIIMGGGLAGLSLARQLKLQLPNINIVVLEKNKHPAPEAAFKVGESTVEMGAHYYGEVLGLRRHLETQQLFKLGLRYFFPYKDNTDITHRFEMGSAQLPTPVPAYQLDRGRFENHLRKINIDAGITFIDNCKVQDVTLAKSNSNTQHQIVARHNDKLINFEARWVVDATGRFGLLKRKLGLKKDTGHNCDAAWFRVKSNIDINTWSQDPQWQARSPLSQRRFSTNHLMGPGYWVWLIPLASGSTSIGIVSDPALHNFSEIQTFEGAMNWLYKHEPQCARAIEPFRKDGIQDFLWLRHFAYGCQQMYSTDRWFLTGEAGAFADAFYSPGSDFIGLGNSYITDLISRDMRNEPIDARISAYNDMYLYYFELLLSHFENHYPNFGNAYLMIQKLLWDTICAFAIPYLLFFKKKFLDLEFMDRIGNEAMTTYKQLTTQVQEYFKQTRNSQMPQLEKTFLNFSDMIHSGYFDRNLYRQLNTKLNDDELAKEIQSNIKMMENLAKDILGNKNIAPHWVTDGGNNLDLWRATKSQLTVSKQNGWEMY